MRKYQKKSVFWNKPLKPTKLTKLERNMIETIDEVYLPAPEHIGTQMLRRNGVWRQT